MCTRENQTHFQMKSMGVKICLRLFVILVYCNFVNAQACTGDRYGVYTGADYNDAEDGNSRLLLHPDYTVGCCGVISEWRARIERPDPTVTYTLKLQVFRPIDGTNFQFIGENAVPVSVDGERTFTIANVNEQISVRAGDVIGWDEPVVSYKGSGNERDAVYLYMNPGTLTAGNNISIAMVTETMDRSYAIEVTTNPGASLTVTRDTVTVYNYQSSGVIHVMVWGDTDIKQSSYILVFIAGASPTVTSDTVTVYNYQSSGVIHNMVWGDTDVGDTATIAETTGDAQFSFNSTNGEVSLVGVTQVNGTVMLSYTATDQCGNTGTGNLVVIIENPAPMFSGNFTAIIAESTTKETTLFIVNATDPGDPNLSCSINPASSMFYMRLNGSDQTIVTRSNAGFNYTMAQMHTVTVVCYDGSTYVSQDYTVYIAKNQPPVIQNLQNSTLINSTHPTDEVVFQVIATDVEGDNLAFHLYCEDTANPCLFEIYDDGNIYLTTSLVDSSTAAYNVYVNVTDEWGYSQTWTLTINVGDLNSPVNITGLPLTISINENNPINYNVHDVTFVDIDTAQTHTWTFLSNPASGYFDILDNGTVILLQSIDYETVASTMYVLDVIVSDPLTSSTGTITVVFQNINEQPEFAQTLYGLSAVEAVAGTSLGTPAWGITDPDIGDSYTLRMDCSPYANYFAMDTMTGEVTLQQEYDLDDTNVSLPTDVTCSVNVTDTGGLYSKTNLTISFTLYPTFVADLNDNTPACTAPFFNFYPSYYLTTGATLGRVTATDGDSGLFGTIYYSLNQTSLGGVEQFAIDGNGLITFLISPSSRSSALNYTARHEILVYATDTGGLMATCSVVIVVGDTTTTAATTTTYRYKDFWDHGTNITWFIFLLLTLLAILGLSLWICWTCKGELGCRPFLRRLWSHCRGGPREYSRPAPPPRSDPQVAHGSGNRDPRKRRVKPVSKHLLQVNFGDDDSEADSDYHVSGAEASDGEMQRVFGSDAPSEGEDSKDTAADGSKKGSDNHSGVDADDEDINDDDDNDSDDDDSDDDSDEDDDDDDDGSDDESESEEEIGARSRNLWNSIGSDDDDDEDYVPKKKQKQAEKHYVEKQRIRSPEVKQVVLPEEETKLARPMKVLICCVCLGDISETDDEIVECDNCGVAVHEGCYGISDNQSAASTESSASTEPWFCDACKAGVKADCELCPNEGGIFKETDAGKWVHLVCALYTPGVAFGDVDKLSPVTLFEMPYAKWGFKECSLCEDARFSRTGVCVSCDAGMCRSYFHVTCAQRNGLLSEASPDEDIADPFYAYCKLHADKTAARAKRRNWLAIQSHVRQHAATDIIDEKERMRFKRKLNRHRQKYLVAKAIRPPAWVPPQKMVRYLTSSPSAVKKMLKKAELMGIITQTQHVSHTTEKQEKRKSHIAPAMSAEFITYYLDRNVRLEKLKCDMKEQQKQNRKLCQDDRQQRQQYDTLMKESSKLHETAHKLRKEGEKLWSLLSDLAGKHLPLPDLLKPKKSSRSPTRKEVPKTPNTVINLCGICQKSHNQHLLARCDKCHLWYHLGCLDPPLTRMPKKTKLMGWQCSKCTESTSEDSEGSNSVNVNAPRRLREKIKEPAKLSHNKRDMEFLFPKGQGRRGQQRKKPRGKRGSGGAKRDRKKVVAEEEELVQLLDGSTADLKHVLEESIHGATANIKDGGLDDSVQPHTPQACTPSDTVNISDDSSMEVEVKIVEQTTPIPKHHPQFQDVSRTGRKIIKKKHYDDEEDSSDISPKLLSSGGSGKKSPEKELSARSGRQSTTPKKQFGSQCVTCAGPGNRTNMVSCDVCEQCYHFACLNPPHKKTPKQRGYTWHCEACDTGTDDSEDEDEDE